MTGKDFESTLSDIYKRLGYSVLTPLTQDFGVDLILQKQNLKIAVQAKR